MKIGIIKLVALCFLGLGGIFIGASIYNKEYTAQGMLARFGVLLWVLGAGAIGILYYLPED